MTASCSKTLGVFRWKALPIIGGTSTVKTEPPSSLVIVALRVM
jgi:hypothetical protein